MRDLKKLTPSERETAVQSVRKYLEKREEILFAYLHGSFVKSEFFRDLDVALFVNEERVFPSFLEYELGLEVALGEELASRRGYIPVDVRVLNRAPLSFQYSVIRGGVLLKNKRKKERVEFEERVLIRYLDFAYHRRSYLKEVVGVGV